MPRTISAALAVVAALAPMGCGLVGLDGSEIVEYEVAPHKGRCFGLFETLCLQVRTPGEQDFRNLFETPRGFEFEWGYRTVIRVEETPVDNPPADGSSIRRVLVRVLSRVAVEPGTSFDLRLSSEAFTRLGPDRYEVFNGEVVVRCLSEADCDALESVQVAAPELALALAHPARPGDPMDLVSFTACERFGPCAGDP